MDICKELIARGYFRAEIPPVIVGRGLAEECRHILPFVRDMTNKKNGLPVTLPEYYSAAAYGLRRREMLIPNPANQLVVADIIAQNWGEIERHYQGSAVSKSKHQIYPPQTKEGRDCDSSPAVAMTMGREANKKERLLQMAGHSHILKADINQFFPSVYTHSIPWALVGKEKFKAHRESMRGQKLEYWGDDLDIAIRNGNGTQTTGIPIGPSTSHIVSEIIMAAIDKKVQKELGGRLKAGYRYVDDYFLCFDSQADAEFALAEIQKEAREFELAVNDRKTEILRNIDYTEESWPRQLRVIGKEMPIESFADFGELLDVSASKSIKYKSDIRAWLTQFASEAFALAKKHPLDSVMNYALKILRGMVIRPKNNDGIELPLGPDNWDLYESILIRIVTAYPYTADRVAEILCECGGQTTYSSMLNRKKLSDAMSLLIKRHAPRDYHTETAWALWLAKVLRLEIADDAMQYLPQVKSGVCALLALDNIHSGLVKTTPDTSPWLARIEDGLHERCWLLAYEAPQRGWLGDTKHIDECRFFSELKKKGVSFYDEKNNTATHTVGALLHYDE